MSPSICDIILWGASGHAKVLREFLSEVGYDLVALFDNNPNIKSPFPDVPLFVGPDGFSRWLASSGRRSADFAVAIGGARGRDRLAIQAMLMDAGLQPATLVHPTAFVARTAKIGAASQILAQAAVAADVVMGANCIINTAATIDHETTMGDGVHVAPGSHVAGCVEIGSGAMIAIGSTVLPGIKIGRDAIVGAGSTVTRDVRDGTVVYGSPARFVRNRGAE